MRSHGGPSTPRRLGLAIGAMAGVVVIVGCGTSSGAASAPSRKAATPAASPVTKPRDAVRQRALAPAPLKDQIADVQRVSTRILSLPPNRRPAFVDPTQTAVEGVPWHPGDRVGSFRPDPFFLCVETWNPATMRGTSWAEVSANRASARHLRTGTTGGCPPPPGDASFPQD